jgi:renalase
MLVAVIGAGMAGLSCADALREEGHEPALFDKARGPGGRMSTRRCDSPLGTIAFDHGASHFTARGVAFRQLVSEWQAQGVVAPWPVAGRDAWVGTPGMNAPIKAMAERHPVTWNCPIAGVTHDGRHWWCRGQDKSFGPFDAVVIAVPVEQALPLISLHDFQMARLAMTVSSQPCWAGMFAFAEPLGIDPDMIRHIGPIGWAVRNSAKPGRTGPEAWVVQGSADWSATHLEEDADRIATLLLDGLAHATGLTLPTPVVRMAHRWRYATPSGCFANALWNPALQIGMCGDWLAHGFVEQAWQSGRALAGEMLGLAQDDGAMGVARRG